MQMYRRLVWPLLSKLDPERAHGLVVRGAQFVQACPPLPGLISAAVGRPDPHLAVTWRGLGFPSPVGLAAGLDKDALAPRFFAALGFGFVEVGTVTPKPQPGNAKPRIHRLPERDAMVNSMGFPGHGVEAMVARLKRLGRLPVPLGINIGKNAATPLERAAEDYVFCLERLYAFGDYFVVNVSSPNTQGLTTLQAKPALRTVLGAVTQARRTAAGGGAPKPLLVKVSPDLTTQELEDVLEVCVDTTIDGVIATNTSADPARKASTLAGGISGKPLAQRSREMVSQIRRHGPARLFIIGAGGVADADSAWALMDDGADLVQVYTALIFRGPGLPSSINRRLNSMLRSKGLGSIEDLRRRRFA